MINTKYIKLAFEKDAAIHGKIIKETLKFVKNHPWLTVGGTAAAVGGVQLVGNVAKSILPSYHILNEERKRGTTRQELDLLKQISSSLKKDDKKSDNPYRIVSVQPLA
jgi:hypothetical protein